MDGKRVGGRFGRGLGLLGTVLAGAAAAAGAAFPSPPAAVGTGQRAGKGRRLNEPSFQWRGHLRSGGGGRPAWTYRAARRNKMHNQRRNDLVAMKRQAKAALRAGHFDHHLAHVMGD